jgi:hypothetical protein
MDGLLEKVERQVELLVRGGSVSAWAGKAGNQIQVDPSTLLLKVRELFELALDARNSGLVAQLDESVKTSYMNAAVRLHNKARNLPPGAHQGALKFQAFTNY